jgi:hypothetical protein
VRTILLFKPKSKMEWRTWTLFLLLLDTAVRIDEVLALKAGERSGQLHVEGDGEGEQGTDRGVQP